MKRLTSPMFLRCAVAAVLLRLFCPTGMVQSAEVPAGGVVAGSDTLQVLREGGPLRLSHLFIEQFSDTLVLSPPGRLLVRDHDYTMDYRHGIVRLDSSLISTIAVSHPPAVVMARYRYLPFSFREKYSRRTIMVSPGAERDTLLLIAASDMSLDDIFGSNLQKSGSIVRGITVGSNRDFSLNSGLRLQLAGRITSEIDVVASLTDENTPIQPEGTTQTLQEFDKVFVQFQGTNFDVVLGDFNIDFDGTQFGRLSRKLQGARGTLNFGSAGSAKGLVTASGAAPRGEFNTNQFQGIEGVQGPYLLLGKNGERTITVIAGTERVFVNGEPMVRGETNDYTIDYSLSELRFTSRRLITSATRIVVDFEYTDRQFGRTFLAAQGRGQLWGNALQLSVTYFREGDDESDPLEIVLDDSARAVIASAGDNANDATVSGVTQVDSNGFYVQVDTLIAGQPESFYRYSPGPSALFVISFSFVGTGQGEYTRRGPGVFEWVGAGLGDYLPVRLLPLPVRHDVIDYALSVTPFEAFNLKGEFAQSMYDANTLSSLNDQDNDGRAFEIGGGWTPKRIRFGDVSFGTLSLSAKVRYIDSSFVAIDRINDIEFGRKWGLDTIARADEWIQEYSATVFPGASISMSGGIGSFRRENTAEANRRDVTVQVADSLFPRIRYFVEEIESQDDRAKQRSEWFRQNGRADYFVWNLIPTFRFEEENRGIKSEGSSSSDPGSFKFHLWAPGLKVSERGPVQLSGEFEWRKDDVFHPVQNAVVRESNTFTQFYQAQVRNLRDFSSTLDMTFRNKNVTSSFEELGNADISSVLVRNQTRVQTSDRWFSSDLFYEVTTQRSSQLQRFFVKVTPGSGNYRYLGDLNNNGIADDPDFELTRYDGDYVVITLPSGEFAPVIDLKTSLRVGLQPRLILGTGGGWLASALSRLSTETYLRIDEKSTETDQEKIYLLKSGALLNDSTTLAGSQLFTQDVHLFEQSPDFSMRFRFQERKSLTQFSTGPERGYAREQSVRIRTQLVAELTQQTDLIRGTDQAFADETSSRNRDILANTLILDFSYRPYQSLEIGFNIELTRSTDRYPETEQQSDLNAENLRFVYSFAGVGQARGGFAREEVLLSGNRSAPAFELTEGRAAGKTWLWRAGFDYRVAQFIQATVSYDGRVESGQPLVHTARAEVQAFF